MTAASATAAPPLAAAHAHWTIYLPSLVVALVWTGVYGYAALHQPPLAGLRALALAVVVLGAPVLLLSAALRARVLAVEVRRGRRDGAALELYARSGFVRPGEIRIGAGEIASLRLRRSLPQRLFGGGALDLKTMSGERVRLADLDRPEAIAAALAEPARPEFGHQEVLR